MDDMGPFQTAIKGAQDQVDLIANDLRRLHLPRTQAYEALCEALWDAQSALAEAAHNACRIACGDDSGALRETTNVQ